MTKHEPLLSSYRQQHNGEKVDIGDNTTIQVASCGDVIIDTTNFGDVLLVPGVGRNLISIYHITHTNKKVEFWSDQWVLKNMNDDFKVVASRHCDESNLLYKLG